MDSLVNALIRSLMAAGFGFPVTRPFTVRLAVPFLPVAEVAFSVLLGRLFFHPLLNHVTVRADAEPPAPDVKAARRENKNHRWKVRVSKTVVTSRQFPLLVFSIFKD